MPRLTDFRLPTIPAGTVRAVVFGMETAVFSWAVPVITAVAAYAVASANPALQGTSWMAAAKVGSMWWAVSLLGVAMPGYGGVWSLIPLGLSLISVLFLSALIKRLLPHHPIFLLAAPAGFLGATAVILMVTQAPVNNTSVLVGAFLLGLGGAAWGMRKTLVAYGQQLGLPQALRCGLRLGVNIMAGWLIMAGIGLLISFGVGFQAFADATRQLHPGGFGGVILALVQLSFLPNLLVWALAWFAGPGFVIGDVAKFSPNGWSSEPLGQLPVFNAMPSFSPGLWVVLVVIMVAAGAAWWRGRKRKVSWTWLLIELVTAVAAVALLSLALVWLSGGSVGPNHLRVLGVDMVAVAVLSAEAAGGIVLGMLLGHPRQTLARWRQTRKQPQTDPVTATPDNPITQANEKLTPRPPSGSTLNRAGKKPPTT